MSETDLQRRILLLNDPDVRLFRNHRGAGWQGSNFTVRGGQVVRGNARFVKFGLCNGASDILGWQSITVTPDMVGQRVSVICSIEAKEPRKYATEQQKTFVQVINDMGGRAGVVRSIEEAKFVLRMPE